MKITALVILLLVVLVPLGSVAIPFLLYAPPQFGAVLPGGRRIERAEKMGGVSNGMLCSGDELNLTSDADGILILPAGTPLGTELTSLYGDTVLDIDVKPNRGDALSLVGLAREISIATGAPVRMPEIDIVESGRPAADLEARYAGPTSRFMNIDGVRIHYRDEGAGPVQFEGGFRR